MASKPKVLIDLNVILDVLQKREPFYALSARVLACAETGLVEGIVAADEKDQRESASICVPFRRKSRCTRDSHLSTLQIHRI